MQAILRSFELDATRRSLVRELSGVDERQLRDIGLIRAADGSLWLAEDPSVQVAPEPAAAASQGVSGRRCGALSLVPRPAFEEPGLAPELLPARVAAAASKPPRNQREIRLQFQSFMAPDSTPDFRPDFVVARGGICYLFPVDSRTAHRYPGLPITR